MRTRPRVTRPAPSRYTRDFLLGKARAQELAKDPTGAVATYKQYLKDLPSADRVQDVRIRLALLGSAG